MDATQSRDPRKAARAPRWAKLQTLLVLWLCRAAAALITEAAPARYPSLQPVMAHPLAKPLTVKQRSRRSSATAAKLW